MVASSETEPLSLYVLGHFRVERSGSTLPPDRWKRRRAVDVLTALAVAQDHAVAREALIRAFWPDKDAERGANNLHRALHDVRKALGGGYVTLQDGIVRLSGDVWVDVDALEGAQDDLDALELYHGAPDLDVEALETRLEEIRQGFVEGSIQAARRLRAVDPNGAIDVLRRLLAIEPTVEEAHRLLMRLLARAGRTREAEAQYRACVEVLEKRLGVAPATATRAVFEGLAEGQTTSSRPSLNAFGQLARRLLGTRSPSPLHGRDAARPAIQDVIDEGSGVLLFVGESGVGKTRLAVEAARWAFDAGAVLLAGVALSYEGMPPYTPFREAFAHACRDGDADHDPFRAFRPSGSAQDDTLRLFKAVQEGLEAIGGGKTVCLLLDDLQYADDSSLQLLHYLARTTRSSSLILLATAQREGLQRGSPLRATVSAMYRERICRRIELDALPCEATRALVEDTIGESLPDEALQRLHSLAEGNPFYVEELAHAFAEHGAVHLPDTLCDTVVDRVTRLGDDVATLLRSAAVVGPRFSFELATDVAGLHPERALDALEDAIDAGLVAEQEPVYRFRHGLLRQALYGTITSARRRSVHHAVADRLEADPAAHPHDRVELLAYHHRRAHDPGRALPYLVQAAGNARRQTGLREAVAFYRDALELRQSLGGTADAQLFEILLGLGGSLLLLSQIGDASSTLDRAANLGDEGWTPPDPDRGRALRLSALALITGGHLDDAEARLRAALAVLEESDDAVQLADTLYYLAQLRWHQDRHAEAYTEAERCLRVAEATGDKKLVAKGYEMLALACHSLGAWREGEQFEHERQSLVGGPVDVAQAFDVHL